MWTGILDDAIDPDDTIRVTFAAPTPTPDQADCWDCAVRIEAYGNTRVHVIHGIDGMQAFRLAIPFAQSQLEFLAQQRGVTSTFLGGGDLFSDAAAAR